MSPTQISNAATAYLAQMRQASRGKIFCATISPGYDDSKSKRDKHYRIDRFGIQTMTALGQAALRRHPDWVMVSTFNEWHEGTEIGPSKGFGFRYIDAKRAFAARFLKS